ncbi:high-potential iron-sulfur protein [Paraburkholderia phymatum]|uniref:high-potential iron-sulfur protein n=1 Tax=Paraburkholderia phymatum TaxID=148447 RepID=UPI00317787AD
MQSNRREFIVGSVVGLVSAAFLPHVAYAAEELSETDPSAVALGYRADATKVDKVKFPKYATGQVCANCQFYQGSASTRTAACPLFNGKTVEGAGWCNGYVKKA